jgi:ABC-2 type transport system permease protein
VSLVGAIARKDALEFLRDRRLLVAAVLVALLALAAIGLAAQTVVAYERDRTAAETLDRTTWLNQGPRNPHGAAHFSSWAFRPLSPLSLLEPGVTPYAGSAIWMEAHAQDPAAARAAEDRAGALDLGNFSLAWLLQTLAPLLIALFAVGLVARERERDTLKLMLASGARPEQLARAKAAALVQLSAVVVVPLLTVGAAAVLLAPQPLSGDQWIQLALWLAAHLIFLGLVAVLATAIALRIRRVDRAMLAIVGLWLVAIPLSPRLAGVAADAFAPLPSARAFWAEVTAELRGSGHERDKALEAATLKKYGVSRLEDLPVSYEGIQLDASERHGDEVFDRLYGKLHAQEDRQRWIMRAASVVSPLVAIQNLSAGLAGTDTAHQRNFAAQAEAHRRKTVAQLNADMIQNAGKAGFDYEADPSLWEKVPSFAYRPPSWTSLAGAWLPDAAILGAWLIAALIALRAAGRGLAREEI